MNWKQKFGLSVIIILIMLGVLYLLDTIQIKGNELIFVWSINITVSSIINKLMTSDFIFVVIVILFILFVIYMLKGD